MKGKSTMIHLAVSWLLLAILLSLASASYGEGLSNRLINGDFEGGFKEDGVGKGWERFDNGGGASYGWYDDQWDPVVFDGEHSQLIEINSKNETLETVDGDRYAGVYQKVSVVPGATYELTIRGLVRSNVGDPALTTQGYRMEWGVDYDGNTNWKAVEDWVDLGWDDQPRESPDVTIHEAKTTLTARGDELTLFFRAHKKWPTVGEEGDFNLDGLSLVGPAPAPKETAAAAETEEEAKKALPISGLGIALPAGAGLLGLLLIALMERRLIADWFRRRWTL